MSAEQPDDQDPLGSLIAEVLEAENHGRPVDRDAMLREHPRLADSLRDFFAEHDRMKTAADAEDPTLPPNESEIDDPTLPPSERASPTTEPAVGDQVRYFGDYELLEEIARGGMGVVFKARQINLNRIVALKMILSGQFAGEEDVQRFQTEAEAAAQLDHPGIVPIFEIGEHQGQHYFSMGYVAGESLAHKVADGPLPAREAAALMLLICDAVQYAHEHGVIHRDLKPANILLDQTGQPKVTDFGLAKRIEAESDLTGTGQILGTPAYMPPEQAAGQIEEIGPLSDVYSLGAILYCLLTGRPPFQAASPMDTLLQVLEQEPVTPRTLNTTTPRDIETICLKCLRKEAKRRYGSTAELREDVQRFVNGEPIHARPVGTLERGWRWCKRKPVVAGLTAAFVASLIIGATGSTYFGVLANERAEQAEANLTVARRETARADRKSREAERNLELAQQKAAEALAEKTRAERQLYNNLISLANQELLANNVDQVERHLNNCPEEYRNFEWRYLWHASHGYLVNFDRHTSLVTTIAVSSDGRLVASSGADRVIWIWKLDSGEVVHRLVGHSGNVADVAFSPDAKLLASASWDRTVRIWDVESGDVVHSYSGHGNQVQCVAFSPDGKLIASGGKDSAIHLWQVGTWKRDTSVLQHPGSVDSIDFNPDGTLLASGGSDKIIRLWSVPSGEKLRELKGHTHFINDLDFSPDGDVLASSCLNDPVFLWDVEQGTKSKELGEVTVNAQAVQFTATTILATSSRDGAINIWNYRASKLSEPSSVLPAHVGKIHGLAFCPDVRRLVSAGEDSTARVWDLARNPRFVSVYPTHHATAFASQGRRLLRDTSDDYGKPYVSPEKRECELTIANIEDLGTTTVIGRFRGWINCLAEGPSNLVAVGSLGQRNTGRITIWRLGDEEPLTDISVANPPIRMIFSQDGSRLITSLTNGGRQYDVAIFDVSDGSVVHRRGPYLGTAHLMDFHDTTERIAGGQIMEERQLKIEIWDARSGKVIRHLQSGGFTWCARFSPDGNQLCTASAGVSGRTTKRDDVIKFWDADSGQLIRTVYGHTGRIASVAYSPDGTRLASKDDDKQLLIWDVSNGTNLLKLTSSRGSVLKFSPDGSRLLSQSGSSSTLYETTSIANSGTTNAESEELVPLEELGRHVMVPSDQVAGFLLGRPHDFWMQGFAKSASEFQSYLTELEKSGADAFPLIEKAFGGNSNEVVNAMSCLSRISYRQVTIPPKYVAMLREQLSHADPQVRVEAIGHLRRFDQQNPSDPPGFDELIELTASTDSGVQSRAIRTLSFWIGTVDTAKLEAVLRDPRSAARSGVARALQLRASNALEGRASPLRIDPPSEILQILIDGTRRRDAILIDPALAVFTALGPEAGDAAVEILTELLDPSDLDRCLRVVEALRRIGSVSHSAAPKLIPLASHSNRTLRWKVADALTAIDRDQHHELITQATSDQPYIENEHGDSLRIIGVTPTLPVRSDVLANQGLSIEFVCTLKSGEQGFLSAKPYAAGTRLHYSTQPVIFVKKGGPTRKTAWFRTQESGSVETMRLTLRVNDSRAAPSLTLETPLTIKAGSSKGSEGKASEKPVGD